MHSEIEQDKPGRCPKCGMKLGPKSELKNEFTDSTLDLGSSKTTWKSYIPLLVIIGLILLSSTTISFKDLQMGTFSLTNTITYFMIGFFLIFSGFKLMDLKGFAQGY